MFQEVVFLEREYLYHDLEKLQQNNSEENREKIMAKICSFSVGEFLGIITLERDRSLDLGSKERNRCYSFI